MNNQHIIINQIDPRPQKMIEFLCNYSSAATTASFGFGYLYGIQTMLNIKALPNTETQPSGRIIEIRDIDRDQAKREIRQYFSDHHGENIDAADLQEALGINVFLAAEICEELEQEGKIKGL